MAGVCTVYKGLRTPDLRNKVCREEREKYEAC